MLFTVIGLGMSSVLGPGGDRGSGRGAVNYLHLISLGRQNKAIFFSTSFLVEAQVRGTLDITSVGIFWYVRLRVLGMFWYLPVRWEVGVIGSPGGLVEVRERAQQHKICIFHL